MRILNGSFSFVALIMFAGVATAKIDTCQPDGMSDAEAVRIIAIATKQGKAFRAAIDALRASGVSYENDTTYDDLMADPERALALAKERYEGQGVIGTWSSYRLEQGDDLDAVIREEINNWVNKRVVNFFALELISHLQKLAVRIGGEPTNSRYRFKINANTFVFALGHFVRSAGMKHFWGTKFNSDKYSSIQYGFSEIWVFRGNRRPNFDIRISLFADPKGDSVTLKSAYFYSADTLKNGWPILKRRNENCLVTFTQTED